MTRWVYLGLALFALTSTLSAQPAKYRRHGPVYLNDLHVTPGATFNVSLATLCQPGYTQAVRNVPLSTKKQVCALYGVPPAHCNGQEVEIDHLVSLEIGGSNDPRNLWPEPYKAQPGAREKDKLENWLHRQVCAGNMPLATAQRGIAQDWYTGYAKLMQSPH